MSNLNEIGPPAGSRHKPKRIGRGIGSGHGKTSCRGSKGQNSRSGRDKRTVAFEGGQMPLIRRLPKRGFHNPFRIAYTVVNLSDLNRFDQGAVVSAEELRSAGLLKKNLPVKILGDGELSRALTVRAQKFSEPAKAKIEKAGGKAEVIK